MASVKEVVVPNPAQSAGASTSDTVSPSAYTRQVVEVTPEFTSVTNSRERFVVVAMSALLLLISCTLFAVLFTLLSDDRTPAKSLETIMMYTGRSFFPKGGPFVIYERRSYIPMIKERKKKWNMWNYEYLHSFRLAARPKPNCPTHKGFAMVIPNADWYALTMAKIATQAERESGEDSKSHGALESTRPDH
ncbi:uncharacterized protein LOC119391785 [Rhipicephalus sanguineus]|uniref:uncharacterized protein LOC119391785 n=1 Tax=Rhipicephalus sanguineus TaxID=34632 RepID=UPI001894D476|nr:uncharacterized protein LOC119391785 [Rhipicephalus sanguineus]